MNKDEVKRLLRRIVAYTRMAESGDNADEMSVGEYLDAIRDMALDGMRRINAARKRGRP